jgi:acetyl esterase/lipase
MVLSLSIAGGFGNSAHAAAPAAAPARSPAPSAAAPAAPAGVLPGWAAGLDKETAGIKPLCMNLWPGDAPGQVKEAPPERFDGERLWEVSIPGAIVYLPPKEKLAASGGTCIIGCMGGGYSHLTRIVGADHTLESLAPKGIAIVSLKYRLTPPSKSPELDAVADGIRAVRLVRAHAKEWGIDPHKIGMIGWSAGSNLILSLSTAHLQETAPHPDAADPVEHESGRPDFAVIWSPWPNKHPAEDYKAGANAPPAMFGSAKDDRTAPFVFAQAAVDSWKAAGVLVEFVTEETGGHGAFELGAGTAGDWTQKMLPWMEKNGWWKQPG